MLRSKLACVFILATVTVQGEYLLSNASTNWYGVNCTLAEPELDYQNGLFELKESLDLLPSNSEAWVGYISTKVPFLFLGCAKLQGGHIFTVKSIGYCHNVCDGGIFGIKSSVQCRCASKAVATLLQPCFWNSNTFCSDCWSMYTQTTANASNELVRWNLSTYDCLTYSYPTFYWSICEGSERKAMCSNQSYTDLTATASVIEKSENTWQTGIDHCLKNNMYPASQQSIIHGGFGFTESQPYWSGVIRAHTLVRKSTKDKFKSRIQEEGYAWITNNDETIHLSFVGVKQAICTKENATPIATTTILQTQDSTHSTNANHFDDQSSTTADPNNGSAVNVGVGVSVAVLFIVGGAVIISVLKRRGNIRCRQNKKSVQHGSSDAFGVDQPTGKIADGVDNHNYFVLEKCTISDADNVMNSNSMCTENYDNYNSINETEEPYARVEDENYDNTTITTEASRTTMTPNNLYNKLGNALPMRTHHAGGKMYGHNIAQEADNEYNTTSTILATQAKSAHIDDGDYNHINHQTVGTENTTTKNTDKNTYDYDVINSSGLKKLANDTTDYAHLPKGKQ